MPSRLHRRQFLRDTATIGTAAAASAVLPRHALARPSANEKLNLAVIGVNNRGKANLDAVMNENIVALCDIDSSLLGNAAARFPKAKTYADFRRMLDQKDLDAVVVSTPDHTHAIPVVRALERGLDVYCEKPLAHSVWEVRQMRQWAAKQNAVTQMGTQIHAGNNYRRVVEVVRSGMLGPIERVHIWITGEMRPGVRVKKGTPPAGVDYDLWIGPAPMRPFHPSHFHYNWRFWFDFGGGELEDFGCHYIDLAFWALDLRYPNSVESNGEKTYQGDNDVPNNMQVDYHFPARGAMPPVHLTWYQGAWRPKEDVGKRAAGVLMIGSKGRLISDYDSHVVTMNDGQPVHPPAQSIPASIGHHQEWINACKTRGATTCNFDYSGALTETVLLGNVSYRLGGKRLLWNAQALKADNCPEAEPLIHPQFRQGWTL